MEINKNKNEIIVKINADDYSFRKLNGIEDLAEFIEYVFDLQESIDGIKSCILYVYEFIEIYQEKIKGFSKEQLRKEKVGYLEHLGSCIDNIINVSTGKYAESFRCEDGTYSISETDNMRLIKILFERIVAIEKLLAKEEM